MFFGGGLQKHPKILEDEANAFGDGGKKHCQGVLSIRTFIESTPFGFTV